jgi:uncharacterized protein YfaP (DUF2135 family)
MIRGNSFSLNGLGISIIGSMPTLINNDIEANIIGVQAVSSEVTMEGNFFRNNVVYALGAEWSTINLNRDRFVDNAGHIMLNNSALTGKKVETSGGTNGIIINNCTGEDVKFENSTLDSNGDTTLEVNISEVHLLNTNFDEDKVAMASSGAELHVSWFLNISVKYTSGENASGAQVLVEDQAQTTNFNGNANAEGKVMWLPLKSYYMIGQDRTNLTPHEVKATKGPVAGNVTVDLDRSMWANVELDDQLPVVTIVEPVEGLLTNNATVVFKGNATDNGPISKVEYKLKGQSWDLADGLEDWNFTLQLAEGDHEITVRATDIGENQGTAMVNVTVDTIPPTLMITTPKDGALVNTTPVKVEGKTDPGALLTLSAQGVDNEVVFVNATGAFEFDLNLTEGENELSLEATDKAGNEASKSLTVVLDTVAPPLTILSPPEGLVTNSSQVLVTGRTEGDGKATVTINGLPMDLDDNGTFSQPFQLSDGTYNFKVVAKDKAGNTVVAERNVTVDTTPPGIEITTPDENNILTNDPYLTVIGLAETSNVTIGGLEAEPEPSDQEGWWKFDELYPLEEGANQILIVASDIAGNRATQTLTVTLDTVPPDLNVTEPEDGHKTKDKQITLSGTTEPGATLTINGTLVTDTDGTFSVPINLELGENTLTIKATDRAGNSNEVTLKVTREKKESPDVEMTSGFIGLILLIILIAVVTVFLIAYNMAMGKKVEPEPEELEEEEGEEEVLDMDKDEDEDEDEFSGRAGLVLGLDHEESIAERPRPDYIITQEYHDEAEKHPAVEEEEEKEEEAPRPKKRTKKRKKGVKRKKKKRLD